MTSRNQNCIICGKCKESARYVVSEKSLEWKPRYMRKGTFSPSKVPLILTDYNKTCTFVTQVWSSNEIPRKEAEIQAKRPLVFQVKYPYTGCNRRNGPDFGRVFFMLNYTEKPQNTYIQSWTVWEIIASEVWNFDSCYTLTDYQIRIETGRNMWFL